MSPHKLFGYPEVQFKQGRQIKCSFPPFISLWENEFVP